MLVWDLAPVKGVIIRFVEEQMNSWVTDPLTFPRGSSLVYVEQMNRSEPPHTPAVGEFKGHKNQLRIHSYTLFCLLWTIL